MRLVFAGTPAFSVATLEALHAAGHEIVGVFTQPDRPAGRGRKLTPSPVALRAEALGLPVFKPEKLRAEAQTELRALSPEVMVVVAYGLILPQAVLDIPRHGCLNIHASLLPRWRGAAPIQRAIEAGDRETGITIMRMDAGLDTGPMLLREAVPIGEDTTAGQLHDTLSALGARLIVHALDALAAGRLHETPQPAQGATYASKLSKDEARIDWSADAQTLARRVRAFNPVPMAWSELDGERVRVLAARPAAAIDAPAGTIVTDGMLRVACGSGSLQLDLLQWPGGRPLSAREAMAARRLHGRRFT
ncbi:methionyl-tRNA formyltransferase [Sinimarinibacterium thermocellulolyticum]|uniref:Methionyl-tRNA formyltransferase n=1 Tax=Sinimarinibacterium thermocellulolyticum TaxID=3170016 RepID=A0ABV2A8A7_9GAMM